MLFNNSGITGLFCFENRKEIFEGVHRSYKFVILTFEKGVTTKVFPAAFMRHHVQELVRFPSYDDLNISVDFIRRLSPDSLSVMEFKTTLDLQIAEKMLKFPLLSERLPSIWGLALGRELHMTDDKKLFQPQFRKGRLPLLEGKTIHQFTHTFSQPTRWIDENEGREALLKRGEEDEGQELSYQQYRLGLRAIARNTDIRTLIVGILPKNSFSGNSIITSLRNGISNAELLFVAGVLNSLTVDYYIRQKVSANVNMFYIYQLPIPRSQSGDRFFAEIVERAAKLICTTPEFDDLAQAVGIGSHQNGVTEDRDRAQLRAELDGMIAHLYNLTEAEFAHILSTFPIVPEATKQAALDAYRTFAPPEGDAEIATLIAQGESTTIEFKSTARWNLNDNKKDPTMEQVILKTVAGFLNAQGGTLLIGVNDAGEAIGLAPDYRTLKSGKQNCDGFELWLMGDLLLKELGNDLAPAIAITFHLLNGQDICKVTVSPSPREVFVTLKDKNGQSKKPFFIRAGNATRSLDDPSEMLNYIRDRWKT